LLTDETSNVTVQLRGGSAKVGRHVQITGSMVPNATPTNGSTQVINVTEVKDLGACTAAGVAVAGAGGGASVGISAVALWVVVVAVAGTVVVGAYAAAGGFGPSTNNVSP